MYLSYHINYVLLSKCFCVLEIISLCITGLMQDCFFSISFLCIKDINLILSFKIPHKLLFLSTVHLSSLVPINIYLCTYICLHTATVFAVTSMSCFILLPHLFLPVKPCFLCIHRYSYSVITSFLNLCHSLKLIILLNVWVIHGFVNGPMELMII